MNHGREDQNPWTKWYWQDWEADTGLRASSLASQGLWMRMLSIMARSKKKGFLLDGESKMESKTLAKLTGESVAFIEVLMAELESHAVYSQTDEGIIFNRRMVREAEISNIRSEVGRLGGRPKKQTESKSKSKTKAPSVSASVSEYKNKEKSEGTFDQFWAKYPRKVERKVALKAYSALIESGVSPDDLSAAVDGYRAEIDRLGTKEKYIKHAATFLHEDRWRDYLPSAPLSPDEWRARQAEELRRQREKDNATDL
jgi:hypothetical protein